MISLWRGDITKINDVDAIVNATNSSLIAGGGVDTAIHKAAGPKLQIECNTIGGCKLGEAKITKAYNLSCKYIIHTVGPKWNIGDEDATKELLATCYYNSLKLAVEYDIKSIAFSAISTGLHGFPIHEATRIAVKSVRKFINDNPDKIEKVIFVAFDEMIEKAFEMEIEKRMMR